jgi:hypothetical protein
MVVVVVVAAAMVVANKWWSSSSSKTSGGVFKAICVLLHLSIFTLFLKNTFRV